MPMSARTWKAWKKYGDALVATCREAEAAPDLSELDRAAMKIVTDRLEEYYVKMLEAREVPSEEERDAFGEETCRRVCYLREGVC
ncbi:MAG: hypothetical protein HZB55_02910 [Deltaproteobacteria bacterium]|nr:hypothetical protein [Deltaproteobacteria bacterium]